MQESGEHSTRGVMRIRLNELSEDYLDQWRRGVAPSIKDYAAQHPEYAVEIRRLFPAVVFAEQLHGKSRLEITPPDRIADFVLHREIGRGGMGVVYEATREFLSQKVALKILRSPLHSSMLANAVCRRGLCARPKPRRDCIILISCPFGKSAAMAHSTLLQWL